VLGTDVPHILCGLLVDCMFEKCVVVSFISWEFPEVADLGLAFLRRDDFQGGILFFQELDDGEVGFVQIKCIL
jgi:hypothetical protein